MIITLPYRFPLWSSLTLFSLVAVLSLLDERDRNWFFEAKWSIALASISFGLGFLFCVAHLINDVRERMVATKAEGVLIVVLVAVWCLAIPVIMSPGNGLAMVDARIVDANLYFSSWAAFGSALVIFASYSHGRLGSVYGSRWWLCLFISSCITMTAAIRLKSELPVCRGSGKREQCGELRLGIALSAISAAIAAGVVVLSYTHSAIATSGWVGLTASVVGLVLWSVNVAYLTFDNGPGAKVGNLFFGTWVSFILTFYLALVHLRGSLSPAVSTSTTTAATASRAAPKEESKAKKANKKAKKPKPTTGEVLPK